jgi:hypothetical protein
MLSHTAMTYRFFYALNRLGRRLWQKRKAEKPAFDFSSKNQMQAFLLLIERLAATLSDSDHLWADLLRTLKQQIAVAIKPKNHPLVIV